MEKEKQKSETAAQKPEIGKNKQGITTKKPEEIGGRGGLDPSRFGDWEIAGKCVDF